MPVAEALRLSPKTVRNQHYRIRVKLGVRTDVELVRLALKIGLMRPLSGAA